MSQMQPVKDSILNQVKNTYRNHPMQTLAVGMGVAILAPAVLPLMKPLAKAAIKSGVSLYEKTKGAIAETGEVIGDIVAEAKAEAIAEEANKVSVAAGLMATSNTVKDTQDN
ncbi:DUF5132 domain-containing protein [Calothrix rhizosoleniae]|uniref:DUF5132 domain-containing protein n=1 Tax=Calothrix rhizosoleniae TaxID=888997 RepID=UPI000B4A29B2|nr:DUF5132 domain-containing protein [Calothrix rhizosoleniae]